MSFVAGLSCIALSLLPISLSCYIVGILEGSYRMPIGLFWNSYRIHDDADNDDDAVVAAVADDVAAADAAVVDAAVAGHDDDGGDGRSHIYIYKS